jgi:hypothetical protein
MKLGFIGLASSRTGIAVRSGLTKQEHGKGFIAVERAVVGADELQEICLDDTCRVEPLSMPWTVSASWQAGRRTWL